MTTISSRHNPLVRKFRDLADTPDTSGERLLLDGAHLVREAQQEGLTFEVIAVAAAKQADDTEEGNLARTLAERGAHVVTVSDAVMRAISPVKTTSGIAAIVRRLPATAEAVYRQVRPFVLVAVDVQDPGNLGSLLRASEAGGVTGVLVCGTSANPFSWKAVRGSMGSVLRLPVVTGIPLAAAIARIAQTGLRSIAAVPRDGRDLDAVDWTGGVALLLGGEGPGLSDDIVARCDQRVTIPMHQPVESLNVAVAGAVLIYAARRQRTHSP